MDIYKFFERLMAMDDASWAEHTNPWSVYTRFTGFPLIALAVWSPVWIGPWFWVLLALCICWIWVNPRLFRAPRNLESWASRGVMGERLFFDRKTARIPSHHIRMANGLSVVSGLGVAVAIYGMVMVHAWATVMGLIVGLGAKAWFADRMVWVWFDAQRDGSA